jgi:hypothetical protein
MTSTVSASAVSATALMLSQSTSSAHPAKASHPESPIMGAVEAASYLNLAAASLAKMRCMGGGPVFIRLGRKIGYMRPDLDKWLAARRATNTSDAAARLPAKLTIAA